MNRRTLLKMAGGATIAGLLGPINNLLAGEKSRPNIVFILTDDQRWDALSCMGHPIIKTPNLDRIANEGVLFENSFVTTSLCSPSRASFLTGQYAHTHGVLNNTTPWDNEKNVTFLEKLHTAGYETAFIGKWHMPGEGLPKLRGVDRFISISHEGGQGVYNDCPLVIDGVETPRPGKYITEDLTDFALDFIEKERDKPFALYLSHKAVHFGFIPPKHLNHKYDDVDLQLPPESDNFITYTNAHPFFGGILPMHYSYRNYCETVESIDEQVGRVLDRLEQMEILDNTVVVFAGDNGHFFGEHGLYDKRLAYEESMRIPFMIRYPKAISDPGRREDQMVLNIDVSPTILSLAGVPVPELVQGMDLAPLLASANAKTRSSWLYEYFPDYPMPIPGVKAVRTEQYKYTEYQNDKRPKELFDLKSDPKEKNNIIHTEQGKKLAKVLKKELERLEAQTM